MGENVTDLTKLRDSIKFMVGASKIYRSKVLEQKAKREALSIEPQADSSPSISTNGDTSPFSKT